MDVEEFRKHGKEMVDFIADLSRDVNNLPVVPAVKPGYLRSEVDPSAPGEGETWQKIMADVQKHIIPGMTWWQHPNFHAYFPAGNSFPSILGEFLAAALGGVGFSWASCPSSTELECIVMDWLGQQMNLPDHFLHSSGRGGGVIQGSASESVLIAMLAARQRTLKINNLKASGRLVAYCSSLAHSCVEKAAMICGVRLHQLNPDKRTWGLRGDTLRTAMEKDRENNLIPFFVCATLGTTSICSFDHLPEIATVLEHEDAVWLHSDCAYAGNAFICQEYQYLLLDGVQRCDSFEFNANKWLLTNFDCGCMFVRDKVLVENTFCTDPLYLQHDQQHLTTDFRNWGVPLSRRFRSLKLWFVIRNYGMNGLQKHIRQSVSLARRFTRHLVKDKRFEQVGQTQMALVAFRLKGENSFSEELLSIINSSGKMAMVPALVDGRYVIRFCICSTRTTERHVDEAWIVISQAADHVLADEVLETSISPTDLLPSDLNTNCLISSDVHDQKNRSIEEKPRKYRRYSTTDLHP